MMSPPDLGIHSIQIGKGWFPEEAGGLNRFYYELLRHLPAAGVGVQGFVTGSGAVRLCSGGAVRSVSPPGAALVCRWWHYRRRISAAAAERGRRVVASHFALYTYPALDVLRDHPLIVHFHGPWASEVRREGAGRFSTAVRWRLERAVYQRGRLFVVLSDAFGRLLQRAYGVSESRIRVVPGGVDADRFATPVPARAAREALGWPTDRPLVVCTRRLVRRMGLENLVAAVPLVRQRIPEVLFVLVGSGHLEGELRHRVAALDLEQHVRLPGHVPDSQLPLVYRAADLTVVPSLALEGFGLVVVESLAAGTPVLVTDVGGLPEVLGDLAPQLVLPDASPGTLASGLVDALVGRLPLPDSQTCMAFARARHDWPLVARRVADIYGEALA